MPRRIYDWKAIQQYHDEGHGFVECQKRFGFTHTAWVKAVKRGELNAGPRKFGDRRRRYDWAEVQRYYDAGNSFRACQSKYGFSNMTWHKAMKRGEIKPRPPGMPIAQLLVGRRNRTHVKIRLLRAGLLRNQCSHCGIQEWRGKPLVMHLDHVNGVKNDNRLANLRMLCPNCHSQTETYSGKNMRRRRSLQDQYEAM